MIAYKLILATLLTAGFGCQITGTWVDRGGNVATLVVSKTNAVLATAVFGTEKSWKTAEGRASEDGMSLWLEYSTNNNQTGQLINNCSAIWWDNDSVWGFAGTSVAVSTVHLVFMAHLDLGYTDIARNVCDLYFSLLLPLNMALSDELRGTSTPFALTTHPVLVAEYLDGLAQCAHATSQPGPAAVKAMHNAIVAGDIRWHAQSANYLPETMDPLAFNAMLGTADRLNAAFQAEGYSNISWGRSFMKSTDVVGLSRSVIPLLNGAGRRALHMGANGKCTMAKVPQAFVWAHPETNTSVLALATNDYGGTIVIPPHVLIMQYQGDNSGPPSAAQVAATYSYATATFPGANVTLSSLDDFAEAVLASPTAAQLPVISSEIGNSWLYGSAADPTKMGVYRETRRAIADALADGLSLLSPTDPNLLAYERRILIGGPEHNGGVSMGAYLPNSRSATGNWSNALFSAVLSRPDYQYVAASYQEKRDFLNPLTPVAPVSAAWTAFLAERQARVDGLKPVFPSVGPASGYTPISDPSQATTCGRLAIAFNTTDGSVASLVDIASGHNWAAHSEMHAPGFLGFSYRTYDETDFATFNTEYTPACGVPCPNFAKPGLDSASPESRQWLPSLSKVYIQNGGTVGCSLLAELSLDPALPTLYGGMASVWLALKIDTDASSPAPLVDIVLSWYNKTTSRMAESSWLSFNPNINTTGSHGAVAPHHSGPGWWLEVLGSHVDPQDVVLFGTRHVHAVNAGFGYGGSAAGNASSFSVTTLDAFLVSPGDTDHLLHYDGQTLPDMSGGVHVNLHNNLWGTSFAQWYGDDAAFRFTMQLQV